MTQPSRSPYLSREACLVLESPPATDLRLLRAPFADGRDPGHTPPIELAWHERSCSKIAGDQFLIEIPYVGRRPVVGIDPSLTERLTARWTTGDRSWTIMCVTAAFVQESTSRGRLRLAMTARPRATPAPRLDGVVMARDLENALR